MPTLSVFAFILALHVTSSSVFEIDLWPGEGTPVFAAGASQLRLHEAPSRSARVTSTARVSPGQRVKYDETRYITTVAGRLTVLAPVVVTGRRLGTISRLSKEDYYSERFAAAKVPVPAGKQIEYLQYRAEGTCFVRVDSVVIDADPCPANDSQRFRADTKPVVEWWIRLTGTHVGWIEVTDKTLKQVERVF